MFPRILAAIMLTALTGHTFGEQPKERDPYDMQFKFLGCTGDWPTGVPFKPIITPRTEQGRQIFHVKNPVDCGLRVRNPRYKISGDSLALSYEVYADGPVAACYCEYNSEFSFKGLPLDKPKVEFQSH